MQTGESISTLVPQEESLPGNNFQINDTEWKVAAEKLQGAKVFIEGALSGRDMKTSSLSLCTYLSRNSALFETALSDSTLFPEYADLLGKVVESKLFENSSQMQDLILDILETDKTFIYEKYEMLVNFIPAEVANVLLLSDTLYQYGDTKTSEEAYRVWLHSCSTLPSSSAFRYSKGMYLNALNSNETPAPIIKSLLSELGEHLDIEKNFTDLNLLDYYLEGLDSGVWLSRIRALFPDIAEIPDIVLSTWYRTIFSTGETSKNLMRNVTCLRDIGVESALQLHNQFGICCYGRYPVEMLTRQLHYPPETRDSVWIINGLIDEVGAFYEDMEFYGELFHKFEDASFTIYEAGSCYDLLRYITRNTNSGVSSKPAVVFLGGHGTRSSIRLSNKAFLGALTPNVLTDSVVEKGIKPLLSDDTTIILNSCSTGKTTEDAAQSDIFDFSIGEELHRRLGVRVIAPKERIYGLRLSNLSLRNLDVKFKGKHGQNASRVIYE